METTLTEQVLPSLLEVATCTPIQPLIRRLAYLVAAQYMARVNPQVHVYTWIDTAATVHTWLPPSYNAEGRTLYQHYNYYS